MEGSGVHMPKGSGRRRSGGCITSLSPQGGRERGPPSQDSWASPDPQGQELALDSAASPEMATKGRARLRHDEASRDSRVLVPHGGACFLRRLRCSTELSWGSGLAGDPAGARAQGLVLVTESQSICELRKGISVLWEDCPAGYHVLL